MSTRVTPPVVSEATATAPASGDAAPHAPATRAALAYLVNQYPKVSHTFIRREIHELERQGLRIFRYSVRRSPDVLVTAADRDEAERTRIILSGGMGTPARSTLRAMFERPGKFFRALLLALRAGRRSERGMLIHLVYLAEACVLRELLARDGVRHLHAHFGTNSATVAMLTHALGGPTFSFTVHGPEEFDKAPLLYLREKIARAAFVIAISEFGRSQLYRNCGHAQWEKIRVVRCGVDDAFLEAGDATTADDIPAAPRLVSVGRLSEQKGQLLLVEALGELHLRGREFEVVLVGDGEMRGEVERAIARHGLGAKVKITGWADEVAVRRHIVEARALVLPSFADGLPVVIMEALALGRPVVSTYVAGIPELVQPGVSGWLVPPGSVEALVGALEEVLAATPTELAARGRVGRARVAAQHDIRTIGTGLRALLEPLL